MEKKTPNRSGFTIVELLTVMGVIAVLIGLLVPALSMVKDFAKEIQQKAQFHSIDVGLEMFKNDFGSYPESYDNSLILPVHPVDNTIYCGANKLAEALVGWDLLGYHPRSGFTANGENDVDGDLISEEIYNTATGLIPSVLGVNSPYYETGPQNIDNRRKYIDLENANAFQMQDLYEAARLGSFRPDSKVLCDVYARKRHAGKKAGMPILYYRARASFQFQDFLAGTDDTNSNTNNDIYNFWDNIQMLNLQIPGEPVATVRHPLYDGTTDFQDFEDILLNRQVMDATRTAINPTGVKQPYRKDSYVLISAGKDGLYGNADDLYNFTTEIKE